MISTKMQKYTMQYVHIVQCALLSVIRIKLHMVNILIAIVITKLALQLSLQLFFFQFHAL